VIGVFKLRRATPPEAFLEIQLSLCCAVCGAFGSVELGAVCGHRMQRCSLCRRGNGCWLRRDKRRHSRCPRPVFPRALYEFVTLKGARRTRTAGSARAGSLLANPTIPLTVTGVVAHRWGDGPPRAGKGSRREPGVVAVGTPLRQRS